MMKISKKWFAVLGFLIFLGVALAPSINAQIASKRYSFEVVGTDSSYPVSSEQLIQIDALIEDYHQASNTDKDILTLLQDFRDIGVISDGEFKRLYRYHNVLQFIRDKLSKTNTPHHQAGNHQNTMCSVIATLEDYGNVHSSFFSYGFITTFPPLGFLFYLIPFLFYFAGDLYHIINGFIPIQAFGMIYFGYNWEGTYYATGNITTSGINGEFTSEGSLLGNIPLKKLYIFDGYRIDVYTQQVAMLGFIGLKIPDIEINEQDIIQINGHHLIGFSLYTTFNVK
jgi:hypothetical protein